MLYLVSLNPDCLQNSSDSVLEPYPAPFIARMTEFKRTTQAVDETLRYDDERPFWLHQLFKGLGLGFALGTF